MIITIDGPVASGKSTVARALAQRLNMYYLYTGLLYRAFAYVLLHRFHTVIVEQTIEHACLDHIDLVKDLSYGYQNSQPYVMFQGINITEKLYETHLDEASSMVSAVAAVRQALLPIQQEIAHQYNIIADGRDCGSYLFPHADFKFYLTANQKTRAQRLMADAKRHAPQTDLAVVIRNIEARDLRDQTRVIAPLVVPQDARVIDNTKMSVEETIETMISIINQKLD